MVRRTWDWCIAISRTLCRVGLNDRSAGITGGEQKSLTLGLNWELNPMSRVMYNYVNSDFTSGTGTDNGTLASNIIRFQVDW